MVAVIDSPDFMFVDEDISSFAMHKKIYFFFKGIFISLIYKITDKKLFCFFINLLIRTPEKIKYENNMFFKKVFNSYKISYPNKRIVRVVKNYKVHLKILFDSYCLDEINFEPGDKVIDCGANIGELRYSF